MNKSAIWTLAVCCCLGMYACRAGSESLLGTYADSARAIAEPVDAEPEVPPASTSTTPSTTPTTPMTTMTTTPTTTTLSTGDCADSTWLVCDDFEGTDAGSPPNPKLWQVQQQNPTSQVVVETSRAHHGSRALHITTGNQGFERAVVINSTAFPALSQNLFGRAFIYIEGKLPQIHLNLVSAFGLLPGQSQPTSINYGSQYEIFLANYYNANDPAHILDLWQHAGVLGADQIWAEATAVPHDTWACLEWQFDAGAAQMRMWLDGKAITRMRVDGRSADCCPNDPWTQPAFSQVAVGLTVVENHEAFTGFSLWLDGLALHSARIGCGASP